jgi:hypothetical protein
MDWQINVIFYTALHLVDAALASLNIVASSHSERNDQVKNNGAFLSVRNHYLDLYRISRITRYDADPLQWLPQKYLTVNDLADDLLKPIENNLGPLIRAKAVRFDPINLDS